MGKVRKWKRSGPKSTRSGCLGCKPHKRQGVDDPVPSELRARLDEREQLRELDMDEEIQVGHFVEILDVGAVCPFMHQLDWYIDLLNKDGLRAEALQLKSFNDWEIGSLMPPDQGWGKLLHMAPPLHTNDDVRCLVSVASPKEVVSPRVGPVMCDLVVVTKRGLRPLKNPCREAPLQSKEKLPPGYSRDPYTGFLTNPDNWKERLI